MLPLAWDGQGGVRWSIKCKLCKGEKVWNQAGKHLQQSILKTREEVWSNLESVETVEERETEDDGAEEDEYVIKDKKKTKKDP